MYSKLITLFTILLFVSTNAQNVRGLWYWTWSQNVNPGSTNLGIAFSGWTDPAQAISDSNNVVNKLQGEKYISLGGGNDNGRWTGALVQKISSYCSQGLFNGYTGVAFDIEEGDAGLSDLFISCFRACKARGYKVLVTISHSTPYGVPDGAALMGAFFREASTIDYMSPQLYTSGAEGSNDFAANGVGWADYKPFSGKLIPSIVSANLYSSAQSYFAGLGIETVGYVQWRQTASTGPAPSTGAPTSSGQSTGGTVRCGTDWAAANSGCGNACSLDGDCPSGQSCFKDLTLCSGSPSNPPPTIPPPTIPPPSIPPPTIPPPSIPPSNNNGGTTRCGVNWATADKTCGQTCQYNDDCPSGQVCYASLTPCSGASNAVSSTRCGPSWDTANTMCGNPCTDDGQCSGGQKCWAALSKAPCGGANAVAENSNVFSETTPVTGKELSPLTIGLIVAGCVVPVVVVAVIVVVVVTSKKVEEQV
jgi:hypothetical protein